MMKELASMDMFSIPPQIPRKADEEGKKVLRGAVERGEASILESHYHESEEDYFISKINDIVLEWQSPEDMYGVKLLSYYPVGLGGGLRGIAFHNPPVTYPIEMVLDEQGRLVWSLFSTQPFNPTTVEWCWETNVYTINDMLPTRMWYIYPSQTKEIQEHLLTVWLPYL